MPLSNFKRKWRMHWPLPSSVVGGIEPRGESSYCHLGGKKHRLLKLEFPPPPLLFVQYHSPICVSQYRGWMPIGQEIDPSHLLAITRDTHNWDR
jgi:hypothetical protein